MGRINPLPAQSGLALGVGLTRSRGLEPMGTRAARRARAQPRARARQSARRAPPATKAVIYFKVGGRHPDTRAGLSPEHVYTLQDIQDMEG